MRCVEQWSRFPSARAYAFETGFRLLYRRAIIFFSFFFFFIQLTAHPFGRFLSHGNEQTGIRIREFRCIVPDHRHKRINYAIEAGYPRILFTRVSRYAER